MKNIKIMNPRAIAQSSILGGWIHNDDDRLDFLSNGLNPRTTGSWSVHGPSMVRCELSKPFPFLLTFFLFVSFFIHFL